MVSDKQLLEMWNGAQYSLHNGVDHWHTPHGRKLLLDWKLRINEIEKEVNERLVEKK